VSLLKLERVGKAFYRSDGTPLQVLDDIDMEIEPGHVTVFIGPSGCGKTTLLRLMNRLEDPTAGRILLEGHDVARCDPLELRRQVVMVPQKPFMFSGTVLDNLRHPYVLRKVPPPAADAPLWREVLDPVGLPTDFLERRASTLSLGQQQRVGLARALACAPRVLLLDEPTSALDRPAGGRLARGLRSLGLRQGVTTVVVTHDLWFAERLADHVVYLDGGKIIERGSARIFQSPQSTSLSHFLMHSGEIGGET